MLKTACNCVCLLSIEDVPSKGMSLPGGLRVAGSYLVPDGANSFFSGATGASFPVAKMVSILPGVSTEQVATFAVGGMV